jgi:hypothetical protein
LTQRNLSLWVLLPLAISAPAYATQYLSVAGAQATLFPGRVLTARPYALSAAQAKAVARASGISVRSPRLQLWQVEGGGWFIVDEVIGKHDVITYAVGVDASGAVRGVEILVYREGYGGEVQNPAWRAQFAGKRAGAALKLDQDIQNISGATLSSRHIADGVRRVLATLRIVQAADANAQITPLH